MIVVSLEGTTIVCKAPPSSLVARLLQVKYTHYTSSGSARRLRPRKSLQRAAPLPKALPLETTISLGLKGSDWHLNPLVSVWSFHHCKAGRVLELAQALLLWAAPPHLTVFPFPSGFYELFWAFHFFAASSCAVRFSIWPLVSSRAARSAFSLSLLTI